VYSVDLKTSTGTIKKNNAYEDHLQVRDNSAAAILHPKTLVKYTVIRTNYGTKPMKNFAWQNLTCCAVFR
jgi:hypothetical protein